MNISSRTRTILNLISAAIQAAIDIVLHHTILAFILSVYSESLAFEVHVFMTGIIVVCFASRSLYGFESLKRPFTAEKQAFRQAGTLTTILTVLFAFTSEETVPMFLVLLGLIVFMAVSYLFRYSLRHVLGSENDNFFRFLRADRAYALALGESDTSLRKDYRYNMKAIYAKKSKTYKFIKRAFDIVSSGCALVVLSPLFLVTAIAIKLEDGGPVFYCADRWGKDMKIFRMRKFRSMVVNADDKLKDLLKHNEMTGHAFKIKNDPRITKVGKFIRKYSIDELPQLWNIFTGDMSVVGPRPIMTVDTEKMTDYDKQRWIVQPGLTCYWQVSGRAEVLWHQWVEMDLDYIERMSMMEDMKLIILTIPKVVKRDGAY